jgi:3-phenylpropionate/trans-cinnamate dioxygenase ferredoxin subunit
VAALAPGEVRLVEWEDLEIGVFNCAGTVYAIEDRCSHDGPCPPMFRWTPFG